MNRKLSPDFYRRSDVLLVARELLGKVLCTKISGQFCSAKIVETEAYCGKTDRACHAYPMKRSSRTAVFYEAGGLAYVYLCYGIHHLFNIVTNTENEPSAVLIRAVEPLEGIDIMRSRRNFPNSNLQLTSGPGKLSQALGIRTDLNSTSLQSDIIWLEEAKTISEHSIDRSPRIGVDYAGADAQLPWRFTIKGNLWLSK